MSKIQGYQIHEIHNKTVTSPFVWAEGIWFFYQNNELFSSKKCMGTFENFITSIFTTSKNYAIK